MVVVLVVAVIVDEFFVGDAEMNSRTSESVSGAFRFVPTIPGTVACGSCTRRSGHVG